LEKIKPRVSQSRFITSYRAVRCVGDEKGVYRLRQATMTLRATVFLALFLIASLRRRAALGRRLLTGIQLTLRLARFSTIRWVFKLLGLVAYALVLSPAFLRVAWSYFTSRKIIRRSIVYGKQPRNTLDVFLPEGADFTSEQSGTLDQGGRWEPRHSGTEAIKDTEKVVRRPVVIFVTGGMWIIGYKAWGALLAQRLARRGVVVVSLDYRNFPQGTIGDMIADVSNGIGWVIDRLDALGADRRRVSVVGQSAGAHIAATALLRQTEWVSQANDNSGMSSSLWSPASISRFIGISGVYAPDDEALVEHVHRQGLYKQVFWSIMEAGFSGARATEALPRASPVSILKEPIVRDNVHIFPPVMLCHGEADTSAPPAQSKAFARACREAGIACDEHYYAGKTHTDPFVTDPILGQDILLDDITDCIFGRRLEKFDERPLIPPFLVSIARRFVPF
jgi:prenylcysteine alpha-carboxyl methylesterase